MKNDWKNSRANCLGAKTDGRKTLSPDNEDFRRLKGVLRRREMSGLKAIKFGLGCRRVTDSPESSQEIQKLAPPVREIKEGIEQ